MQYGCVPGPSGSLLAEALLWIELAGGQLLDEGAGPVWYPFAAPATVAAVRWYAELTRAVGMPDILETTVASQEEVEAARRR